MSTQHLMSSCLLPNRSQDVVSFSTHLHSVRWFRRKNKKPIKFFRYKGFVLMGLSQSWWSQSPFQVLNHRHINSGQQEMEGFLLMDSRKCILTLKKRHKETSCPWKSSGLNIMPSHEDICMRACSVTFDSLQLPWSVACQAPPSTEFSRQAYWSGLPFPSPGDLPDPEIEPGSPALQADSLLTESPGRWGYNGIMFTSLGVGISSYLQPEVLNKMQQFSPFSMECPQSLVLGSSIWGKICWYHIRCAAIDVPALLRGGGGTAFHGRPSIPWIAKAK